MGQQYALAQRNEREARGDHVPSPPVQSRWLHRGLTSPEHHKVAVDVAPGRLKRAEARSDRIQLGIVRVL